MNHRKRSPVPRHEVARLRLTEQEKLTLCELANENGMTISGYLWSLVMRDANRMKEEQKDD